MASNMISADLHMLEGSLRESMAVEPTGSLYAWGQLILRAAVGLMIFYIHGWRKLKEGINFMRNGTPWNLADEVAAMRLPSPVSLAIVATTVQFVCSLLLVTGLLTRLSAALLTATIGVAIVQNVLARRDPQLPILYVLILITMIFLGGGSFSLDAKILSLVSH